MKNQNELIDLNENIGLKIQVIPQFTHLDYKFMLSIPGSFGKSDRTKRWLEFLFSVCFKNPIGKSYAYFLSYPFITNTRA